MTDERLTREERLDLVAELCPRYRRSRPCDSYALARERALEILELPDRPEVTADYVLMRAVDRYAAGTLSLRDLYRCRLLAYYMTFAVGGEEWGRWGLAAGVRPGEFTTTPILPDPDDLPSIPPPGPPWGQT